MKRNILSTLLVALLFSSCGEYNKLLKSTGLDLRVFEDAITFKIALMVVKYMKYMESFEY